MAVILWKGGGDVEKCRRRAAGDKRGLSCGGKICVKFFCGMKGDKENEYMKKDFVFGDEFFCEADLMSAVFV